MKVIVVEPLRDPYIKDIECTLEAEQEIVDGYIEAIYPFEDEVCLICNEEGKYEKATEPNRCLYDEQGECYDVIYGTFFVCSTNEGEDLPQNLIDKYMNYYKHDHLLIPLPNGHVRAVR